MQERDELRARVRRGEASKTTIAERQELERALHTAREELFRERKHKREQLEEMDEVRGINVYGERHATVFSYVEAVYCAGYWQWGVKSSAL